MGFLCTGLPPSGTTITNFLFEAYGVYEMVGAVDGTRTASVDDPVGFSAVTNALASTIEARQPTSATLVKYTQDFLGHVVKSMGLNASSAIAAAGGVVGAAVGRRIRGTALGWSNMDLD